MKKYYTSTTKEIIEFMGTDINKGLLEYECTLRRETFGDNEINLPFNGGDKGIFKNVISQLHLIISIIAIIIFINNKLFNLAVIISLLIIINITIKLYSELKKKKELDILYKLNTSTVTIIREGVQRIIPTVELVKGDIVVVKKGSFIGADMRIIESKGLKVDEKNITGEEFLKEKYETKHFNEVQSIGEINNMLFRGTLVKEGSGLAVVVKTGIETQLGKLLSTYVNEKKEKHTLYSKIEKIYTKIFICLVLLSIILYVLIPGSGEVKNTIFSYNIFAIISISLPLISIIYSKILYRDLLKENLEVVNLSALDIINTINIMFINKYGNITKKKLEVVNLYTNDEYYDKNNAKSDDINIKRMLDISLLTNKSKYNNNFKWEKGDMYEISYSEFSATKRIFKSVVDGENVKRFEIPYTSDKNIVTVVTKNKKGFRANSRGTLEEVLNRCSYILINGIERELNKVDIEKIKYANFRFSKEGLITEAFCYRSFNYQPTPSENIESHMVFVGIIAHENLINENINEKLKEIVKFGVLPIVFTDDNKISAEVMGRKIGLIKDKEEVTTEGELRLLSEKDALNRIAKTRIFCRTSPEFKNKIINLFKKDGFKLITEGETLGDLPILSNGNLSVTRGGATTLLKSISDLYGNCSLLDIFTKLKLKSEILFESIGSTIQIYSLFILSQIIIINLYYVYSNNVIFSSYFTILSNLFYLTAILILNMQIGKRISTKILIYKFLWFMLLPICTILMLDNTLEFSLFVILAIQIMIFVLVNSEVELLVLNRYSKILIIAVVILILAIGIMYFVTKPILTKINLIILLFIVIIYTIGEIFLKNCQE